MARPFAFAAVPQSKAHVVPSLWTTGAPTYWQFDGSANPTGVGAGVLVGWVIATDVVAAVGTGLELTPVCVGVGVGTAAVHESANAAASRRRIEVYFMSKIVRRKDRSSIRFGDLRDCYANSYAASRCGNSKVKGVANDNSQAGSARNRHRHE